MHTLNLARLAHTLMEQEAAVQQGISSTMVIELVLLILYIVNIIIITNMYIYY